MGPFSRRMVLAQFEQNGEIWITKQNEIRPVIAFGKQPEGFPISPNT